MAFLLFRNCELNYTLANKNEELRNDFNYEVKNKVNKAEIIKIARKNPKWVQDFVHFTENGSYEAYDLTKDNKGLYSWSSKSVQDFVLKNPINVQVQADKDFISVITFIINQFKLFIEDCSGYRLLWDDKFRRGKSEEASQLLFYGIVKNYCIANNIDLSRAS